MDKGHGKPLKTKQSLQKEIHALAVAHGWYETPREVPELIALIHSEVSECLEAYRNWDDDNFAEECADIAIRLMDMCEYKGVDLEFEIIKKHEINKKREYRHGGKRA